MEPGDSQGMAAAKWKSIASVGSGLSVEPPSDAFSQLTTVLFNPSAIFIEAFSVLFKLLPLTQRIVWSANGSKCFRFLEGCEGRLPMRIQLSLAFFCKFDIFGAFLRTCVAWRCGKEDKSFASCCGSFALSLWRNSNCSGTELKRETDIEAPSFTPRTSISNTGKLMSSR